VVLRPQKQAESGTKDKGPTKNHGPRTKDDGYAELKTALGFDPRGYRDRLDQAPACLNVLDFRDPVRARLMLFNDTSHYADRPRSPDRNLSNWWDRLEV
jgi:hypothetical protein